MTTNNQESNLPTEKRLLSALLTLQDMSLSNAKLLTQSNALLRLVLANQIQTNDKIPPGDRERIKKLLAGDGPALG